MFENSILTKQSIETILATARRNLETDGGVCSVLFVQLASGQREARLVTLPATSEEKRTYFAALGRALRQEGKLIQEAVLVSEGWFVRTNEAPDAFKTPPSQHPLRQEAITVIGRNASGTRVSSVVQPFTRDGENKPIWCQPIFASYNEASDKGYQLCGLIDNLFPLF